MYFVTILKRKCLVGRFFYYLFFSIVVFILYFPINKYMSEMDGYRINIVDYDNTVESKLLVEEIKKIDGVKTDGLIEAEYIIKRGFETSIKAGNLESLIDIKIMGFNLRIEALTDLILNKIISRYIYLDLYKKVEKLDKISFDEYISELSKTEEKNNIISINKIDYSVGEKAERLKIDYFIILLLLFIALNMNIEYLSFLKNLRISNILERLGLSGIKTYNMVFLGIVISIIRIIIYTFPIILLLDKTWVFAVFMSCLLNYLICCLMEAIIKIRWIFLTFINILMLLNILLFSIYLYLIG